MMGVGAKRAIGLYRSCAPRQAKAANTANVVRNMRRSMTQFILP